MGSMFTRSSVVMGQLARVVVQTPPSEQDSPFEYIDQSLTILGRLSDATRRAFNTYDKQMRQEFLSQRQIIESHLSEVDEAENWFAELGGVSEDHGHRLDKQKIELQDVKVQLENSKAITRNGLLRRMHQRINLIKVRKPTNMIESVWTSHPEVPKQLKDIYILGQQAKGIFESSWEGKANEQKDQAREKALQTILELASFYDVAIQSDERSDSDATEAMLSIDEYMEDLLAEWGMDWQKVLRIGMQHIQLQPPQAGDKRATDGSSGGDRKRTREL